MCDRFPWGKTGTHETSAHALFARRIETAVSKHTFLPLIVLNS
jgi:hypothetical protein